MKTRGAARRVAALAAGLVVFVAACSSSTHGATGASTSTTDTLDTPNSIPFEVGAPVGLPNGWMVRVSEVHRPYTNPNLPGPKPGREYVAVDLTIENQGSGSPNLHAAKVFSLGDGTGRVDPAIAVPGVANGLDGRYPPGTNRAGQLVFDVPAEAALRMAMDGPLIGTQRTIFLIDPPKFVT